MARRNRTGEASTRPVSVAIPGTEVLYDLGNSDQTNNLQHVKHGDGHILLVPQPSLTDASDPLRWTKWKKWVVLFNAMWYSFNGGVTGPIMSGGMISGASFSFESMADKVRNGGANQDVRHDSSENQLCKWCNSNLPRRGHGIVDVSKTTAIESARRLTCGTGLLLSSTVEDQFTCFPIF